MKQQITSLLTLASSIGLLSASSISVNFNSDRDALAALAPAAAAGAPGYSTSGWNNFNDIPSAAGPYTQTTADIDGPNAGSLSNDGGIIQAGTTVSWSANNTWNTNNGTGNPDNQLMNGYLDNNSANPIIPISITGVPYSSYTVVAYFGSDGNDRTGLVDLNGDAFSYSTYSQLGGTFPVDYLQTTDTGTGNPNANYAVWTGQTATDFTLSINRGSNNSGFHGFQIIESVPEPSTGLLFGLSGLLLFRRKR